MGELFLQLLSIRRMKVCVTRVLLCVLLLLPVPLVFARQLQGHGQSSATPSPSPESQPQSQQSSTGAAAERARDEANLKMQDEIQDILNSDPLLDGAQIQTTADDEANSPDRHGAKRSATPESLAACPPVYPLAQSRGQDHRQVTAVAAAPQRARSKHNATAANQN
jgi:hypothetical protein